MKIKGSLRNLVRRFKNGKKNVYIDGDWKIVTGGYDCWFEIYLNDIFFLNCINGRIEAESFYGMDTQEFLKYKKIVEEEYFDKE